MPLLLFAAIVLIESRHPFLGFLVQYFSVGDIYYVVVVFVFVEYFVQSDY